MGDFILLVVIATSIWVLIDAKTIGVEKGKISGLGNMGPWGWFFSCLGLWVLAFPFYIAKRPLFKAATKTSNTEKGRKSLIKIIVLVLVGLCVLVFTAGVLLRVEDIKKQALASDKLQINTDANAQSATITADRTPETIGNKTPCKEYTSLDGKSSGVACKQEDGTWKIKTNSSNTSREMSSEDLRTNQNNSIKDLKKKAEAGDVSAQTKLGLIYLEPAGDTPPSPEKALPWFQKAAAGGSLDALVELGSYYSGYNMGVPHDAKKAEKLWRKAAEQGSASAADSLGFLYENGDDGIPPNSAEAVNWYQKAANAGDSHAKEALKRLEARLEKNPKFGTNIAFINTKWGISESSDDDPACMQAFDHDLARYKLQSRHALDVCLLNMIQGRTLWSDPVACSTPLDHWCQDKKIAPVTSEACVTAKKAEYEEMLAACGSEKNIPIPTVKEALAEIQRNDEGKYVCANKTSPMGPDTKIEINDTTKTVIVNVGEAGITSGALAADFDSEGVVFDWARIPSPTAPILEQSLGSEYQHFIFDRRELTAQMFSTKETTWDKSSSEDKTKAQAEAWHFTCRPQGGEYSKNIQDQAGKDLHSCFLKTFARGMPEDISMVTCLNKGVYWCNVSGRGKIRGVTVSPVTGKLLLDNDAKGAWCPNNIRGVYLNAQTFFESEYNNYAAVEAAGGAYKPIFFDIRKLMDDARSDE